MSLNAALNTSCTDLLTLLENKWFGAPDGCEAVGLAQEAVPELPRRPSASQLAGGRRSGSGDRLALGSGDSSLGAVVTLPTPQTPPANGAGVLQEQERGRRHAAPPPPGPSQPPPQPQPQASVQRPVRPPEPPQQMGRQRSEPLPAAVGAGYAPEAEPPAAGPGGGGQLRGEAELQQLGTWADRQRVFLQQAAQQAAGGAGRAHALALPATEEQPGGGPAAAAAAAAALRVPDAMGRPGGAAAEGGDQRLGAEAGAGPSVDEEDELNAAWRWRFARKWQTEQAKQFDPEYGREGADDEWGDALGYMDALAGGLNLQIARTISVDNYNSLPLTSPTLSQSMLLEASIKESPLTSTIDEGPSMNATKHIVAVAKRAQQLLKQQQEIERQVEQRWESATAGQPWVGQHLPAVAVDSWGRFPFVLVRLLDRSARHKLLVRGKNGAEEGALFAQLEQEVSRAAVVHRLPGPRLELLGSGVMEWSRERDRCLNVTATKLHSLSDARLRAKSDVSKLAGNLAQSSLPVTYRIVVEGTPLKA